MTNTTRLAALALLAPLTALATAAHAQVFSGLGFAPGANSSFAFAVSADGSTVVGLSNASFRWTRAAGFQNLGTLPNGTSSQAMSASADGSVVAGYSATLSPNHAYRWTAAGMQDLGALAGSSFSFGISGDGSIVAGYSNSTSGDRAFISTNGGPVQSLGVLDGTTRSRAQAVSTDGSTVVGYCLGFNNDFAFRWTSANGMQSLGTLPGGFRTYAHACSGDGSVIVGYGLDASGAQRAYRWTEEEGFTALGALPTGTSSVAYGVSGDGNTIVGSADAAGFQHAAMWQGIPGPIDLNTYLPTIGADLTGWTLSRATGVSADGRTIVGNGVHNGASEAWVAVLPPACGSADFNGDGDVGTDQDIEAFFACLGGNCCPACGSSDFNSDGDVGTDQDIESFFRVLGGGSC